MCRSAVNGENATCGLFVVECLHGAARRQILITAIVVLILGFHSFDIAETQQRGSSGNVRVNMEWNENVDLDLYVKDPCGQVLGFSKSRQTNCQGRVGEWDYDDIGFGFRDDNPNAENITWTAGAPTGRNSVHVNYYSGSVSANYRIRTFYGAQEKEYSGQLGPADRGRRAFVADFEADEVVNEPLTFSDLAIPDQRFLLNQAIASLVLPAASGGVGPVTYSISPSLPEGVVFEASTRTLSGTPTEISSERTYTYTATGANGATASLSFSLSVSEPESEPFTFSESTIPEQHFLLDKANTGVTLPATSGEVSPVTYSITLSLPT